MHVLVLASCLVMEINQVILDFFDRERWESNYHHCLNTNFLLTFQYTYFGGEKKKKNKQAPPAPLLIYFSSKIRFIGFDIKKETSS